MEKISVALCTYNGAPFLVEQLESIIGQTVSVDEIIICDDLSDDDTIAILKSYQTLYPKLIHYYPNATKLYTVKNFERAISLTTGDYIFLSDQDDVWEPQKIEIAMRYFKVHPGCLLLFTNGSFINDDGMAMAGNLWDAWGFDEAVRAQWLDTDYQLQSLIQNNNKVTGATIGFRKTLKKDIIPMHLPKGIWHDCYMALLAAKYKGLHFIDEKLIKYRVHNQQQVGIGNGTTAVNDTMISYGDYRDILKKDFETYLSYYDAKYMRLEPSKNKRHPFKWGIKSLFKLLKK